MKHFGQMIQSLATTNSKLRKVAAIRSYLLVAHQDSDDESKVSFSDCAWALRLLCGEKAGAKSVTRTVIRDALIEFTDYPKWLIDVSYRAAGDFGDTISKVIPRSMIASHSTEKSLSALIEADLLPLPFETKDKQKQRLMEIWSGLTSDEIYLFHKLMSGTLRIGVAKGLVIEALNEVYGALNDLTVSEETHSLIAHRLTAIPKSFKSSKLAADWYQSLVSNEAGAADHARPYPFCLANPFEKTGGDAAVDGEYDFSSLGETKDWQFEWKWDGIRAQMIRRNGQVALWSRGEEAIEGSFPELITDGQALPDGTVIDGEILAYPLDTAKGEASKMALDIADDLPPLSFNDLQQRLNRKMRQAGFWPMVPVIFLAYDILEEEGKDIRGLSMVDRRHRLNQLFENHLQPQFPLLIRRSPVVEISDWPELMDKVAESEKRGVEGFMLKHVDSQYVVGRKRGVWWKLKRDPYTIDAVLISAEPGHGKRAGIHSRYTLGLIDDRENRKEEDFEFVPVAKAYSGLSDEELSEMDDWIVKNTVQRYGVQRLVQPVHVFEIAFQSVQDSKRHKSGVALRFPRIHRWRKDKTPKDIDTLGQLKRLVT